MAIGIYGYVKIKDMNGDKIDEGIEKELQKGIQKLIDEYKTHPDPKNPALETLDLLQSQVRPSEVKFFFKLKNKILAQMLR